MKSELGRLTLLADTLEMPVVKASCFNLNWWFHGDFPANLDGLPECDAAACAIGIACLIPEFQALGFRLERFGGNYLPTFGDHMGYRAVERFFGLTSDGAEDLFDRSSYDQENDQLAVAERIRAFVKQQS